MGIRADMPEYEKRSGSIYNYVVVLTMLISLLYAFLPFIFTEMQVFVALGRYVNTALFLLYTISAYLSAKYYPRLSRTIYGFAVQVHILSFTIFFGWDIGNYLYYLAVPVLPYLVFFRSTWGIFLSTAGGLAGLFISLYIRDNNLHLYTLPAERYQVLFMMAFFCVFAVIFTVVRFFFKFAKESEEKLNAERKKSERLLLNILPAEIAARLQNGEMTIADYHSGVAVLFADIVGFTSLTEKSEAPEIVRQLNEIFSLLDILAEKHNLEKIKTIGDSYMVAGGIPQPDENALENVCHFALEAIALVGQVSHLKFRIGIDYGPVMAGVIGSKKFVYDLWGDTVNTASCMESHSETGRIQVTDSVVQKAGHLFKFEKRGEVFIKGKGNLTTWFLTE